MSRKRSVAVVHDFLYCYGGAERVLEQILQVYPEADLFALFDFLPDDLRGFIQGKPVQTTFLQRMPLARRMHRHYLPLMPLAVEQLDLSAYDLVISSSYLGAKGVLVRPDQLHVCYCHTPARYAWDLQHQYLQESGLTWGLRSMLVRLILHYVRNWDTRTANGVDVFVTGSEFVARRVLKAYRRSSTTMYPPVDVEAFALQEQKEDFYVVASRMVPYKRIDLIVEAFAQMPERRLVVIGDGPDFGKVRQKARGNIELLGHQPFSRLRECMQKARAFVFAAEEDFGMVPVEAQACGTPVIAYQRGGATESVVDGCSGLFFAEQTVPALIAAVQRFETEGVAWDARRIRQHTLRFSASRFREEFADLVEKEWTAFQMRLSAGQCAACERLKLAVVPDVQQTDREPRELSTATA